MQYILPSFLFATPAIAHPGHHVHPHDGSSWLFVVLLLAVAAGTVLAVKLRK